MRIFADEALLPDGWARNVAVDIASDGKIADVIANASPESTDHRPGILLPAPVNAHSHAFQRAMAGLTEQRGPNPADSFWTWRRLMFRFLDQLTPEHIQAIAAFTQMEMLEAGYATNVEFHYLHHQPGGVAYQNLAELSERCVAAAQTSGIGLTLLPVFYQYGGCDRRALTAGQVRFGNDIDQFSRLVDGARSAVKALGGDAHLGVAPHSLRAVAPEELKAIPEMVEEGPIHLHLAEQIAEVDEVEAAWGMRPVEWLLDNAALSSRWCLIHCTQMLPHETVSLAQTGAVAGLCPITESSLGDGIFDGRRWLDHNGNTAIGSDSNIRISLSEELRTLEYSQRLRDHSRAALATPEKSTGRRLFDEICTGGALAAGRKTGAIKRGNWADLVTLDANDPNLLGRTGDTILDSYIFASDDHLVKEVWSAGRHVVKSGQHVRRDEIVAGYRRVIAQLGDSI
ncbi:MAG: formimidoylglutamate deiminase [Paracoccaceae bacterium]